VVTAVVGVEIGVVVVGSDFGVLVMSVLVLVSVSVVDDNDSYVARGSDYYIYQRNIATAT
jgi:hypothetical protein